MHSLELQGLPGVHLQDDPVGQLQPGLVIAHRRRRDELAVRGDAGDLHQRDVEMAEEPFPGHLGDVGEVQIHVVHLPGVDLRPAYWIGHVGQTKVHAVYGCERAVEIGSG